MLNPALYSQLEKLFPDGVKISNEGEPLVFGFRRDHNGVKRKWKEQAGESYNVCCPICGDTRFRLSISYAWGLDDKEGYPTSKLVNCYNERCQERYDEDRADRGNARLWLERRLRSSYLKRVSDGTITVKPVNKDRGRKDTQLPFPKKEWVSPLDLLPATHPVIEYIHDRNFDPVVLYKEWGVVLANQFPVQANNKDYGWLAGRLFIPTPGKGWQARTIYDDQNPKYFSCPGWKKSHQLYGVNLARQFSDFVMLCEGVTDVWRVGGPGVAIFGKKLSTSQVMQIRRNWGIVGVLLDPDSENDQVNSMRRAINQLNQVSLKTFRVVLPGNKDAASCSYDHLWHCIEKSAEAAGISIHRPKERLG